MKDRIKNDEYYIEKIREQINFIIIHMNNITKEQFEDNVILQDSMVFRLTQLYEYSKGLSEEYKFKSEIP